MCGHIEEEVVSVLTHKFGWEAERVRADLALYRLDARAWSWQGPLSAPAEFSS